MWFCFPCVFSLSLTLSLTLCLLGSCKLPTGGDQQSVLLQKSRVNTAGGGSLLPCSRHVLVLFKSLSVECGANFEHFSVENFFIVTSVFLLFSSVVLIQYR